MIVPTIVIAESTTGTARDAPINRVLKQVDVIDLTERIAGDAARLRLTRPATGVSDAILVATADQFPRSIIWTLDPGDLTPPATINARTSVESI